MSKSLHKKIVIKVFMSQQCGYQHAISTSAQALETTILPDANDFVSIDSGTAQLVSNSPQHKTILDLKMTFSALSLQYAGHLT